MANSELDVATASGAPRQTEVQTHYRALAPLYQRRANRTCERTFRRLLEQHLAGKPSLLEVGCGSNDHLDQLGSPFPVGCDLSLDMLRSRARSSMSHYAVSAGETLPFRSGQFDGLFLINVLEHVASVDTVLAECARVLKEKAICVAVTPNGNWELWLDLAERWNLKLPEGPHAFLTVKMLRDRMEARFRVLQHRTMLVLPAGPPALARLVDRLTCASGLGFGFFQIIVAQKDQDDSGSSRSN